MNRALRARRPGPWLMHHSDPTAATPATTTAGASPRARSASTSRTGDSWGQRHSRELLRHLKAELVDEQHYRTREQAVASIGDYTSTSVLLQPNPLAPGRPAFLRARAPKFQRLGVDRSTSGSRRSWVWGADRSTSGSRRSWVWGVDPSTSGSRRSWVWEVDPSTSDSRRS